MALLLPLLEEAEAEAVAEEEGMARGGPPPMPAAKAATPTARALYDYQGQTPDELSFREGETITVLKKDPGGWWEGEVNGRRGWLPANYVQEQ